MIVHCCLILLPIGAWLVLYNILHLQDLISLLLSNKLVNILVLLLKIISRLLSVFCDTFKALCTLELLSHLVPFPYLLTVTLIGLGTLWTEVPSLVWCYSLAILLFPDLPRNKALCLVHPLRLNTVPWLLPLWSYIGLECFFVILVFFFLILHFSSVIMLVLWPLPLILCFMLVPSTLRLTTILFVRRFSGVM